MTRPWDGRSNIEGADLAGSAPRAEIVEAHDERKLDAPPVIHSIRLPGLVAHQEVILGGPGQYLTIRHDTTSREAFVPGVLLSLEKLHGLPPGLTVGLGALLED